MSDYHRGPYRGPITGGLPGLLVVVFCLILTAWFAGMLLPLPVIVCLVVVAVGFFVLLRPRGSPEMNPPPNMALPRTRSAALADEVWSVRRPTGQRTRLADGELERRNPQQESR